jgi:glycosyltransferase involved in cell wall biosynthesis
LAPVTIVIPVRERADLLAETLRSVAEQTVPPAEVIVADDGSRDGSSDVAARAGARVLRRAEGGWGAAGARNAALAAARGERVLFLDSDDLLVPTALARLGAGLDAQPDAPFAYGRALAALRDGAGWHASSLIAAEPRELADPAALFVRNAVPSGGALVRIGAARTVGGYDASLPFSEDHDFFLRLVLLGAPAHVPAVVAIHRRHPENRHRAFAALASDRRISGLAERDARLRARLPERAGSQLAEVALEAARRRRPGELLRRGAPLLAGSGSPVRTLRASGRYLRARGRWARAGAAVWAADDELRAWLEGR